MNIHQSVLDPASGPDERLRAFARDGVSLVLVFGALRHFEDPALAPMLRGLFAGAPVLGCSTAGEIGPDGVDDGTVQVTAIRWSRAVATVAETEIAGATDSHAAGRRLGARLASPALRNVLVLAPGTDVNGSALIEGIQAEIGPGVRLSGGLAGGGGSFERTWVLGDAGMSTRHVVAVGLDDALRVSYGCFGGWQPFGPKRRVTRADGNVLYELDGKPALELYRHYLGEYAKDLPAAGLLFPFKMARRGADDAGIIRTILGIDEAAGSLMLAGHIDPDADLQLMHASTDALVDGAHQAAEMAHEANDAQAAPHEASLVLLVSCVGRKLAMGARVDEEIEVVREIFGEGVAIAGFYSHGEISPSAGLQPCDLHNQTMTVTWIRERES